MLITSSMIAIKIIYVLHTNSISFFSIENIGKSIFHGFTLTSTQEQKIFGLFFNLYSCILYGKRKQVKGVKTSVHSKYKKLFQSYYKGFGQEK